MLYVSLQHTNQLSVMNPQTALYTLKRNVRTLFYISNMAKLLFFHTSLVGLVPKIAQVENPQAQTCMNLSSGENCYHFLRLIVDAQDQLMID